MKLVAHGEEAGRAAGLGLLAGSRQPHIDRGDDALWGSVEHEHAVGQVDGLIDVVRNEERSYLLMYLREFAGPDGILPTDFDGLVRDAFGDVLHTVGA